MISRILVPHDGTEMSDKAVEKAVELAKALPQYQLVEIEKIKHRIDYDGLYGNQVIKNRTSN